jgi:hypothetical protein
MKVADVMSLVIHHGRTSIRPPANVLRLTIPRRGRVQLRREPARVIPLRPRRDVGEWRESVLALAGIALMFAVAMVSLAICLRTARGLAIDPFVRGPLW